METIVKFFNASCCTLVGVLHTPSSVNSSFSKTTCIVLLNAGVDDNVGPQRLYLLLARLLASNGYNVLRFDYHGVGGSEGELDSGYNFERFFEIENGLFVGDTLAALDFLKIEYGFSNYIIIGWCGGAVTAMLSSKENKGVTGLVLIDPPVSFTKTVNSEVVDENIYLKKFIEQDFLLRLSAVDFYKKLFLLQIDVLGVVCKFSRLAAKRLQGLFLRTSDEGTWDRKFNQKFLASFQEYLRTNGEVLFILAGNSVTSYEFEERFFKKYIKFGLQRFVSVMKIPFANHEFHALESQDALFRKITDWLDMKK